MSKTRVVEKWVDEAAALTKPSKVIWADGSKQEYDRLVEEMLRDGTLLELNQKTYPGCFLHRSHPQDVARTEQLTFICTRDQDDAGPYNWMAPAEAKAKAGAYFKNSMKDRRMWVIPYLAGARRLGPPAARASWSPTSAYVVAKTCTSPAAAVRASCHRPHARAKAASSRAHYGMERPLTERRLILHFRREAHLERGLELRRECPPRKEVPRSLRIGSYQARH